MGWTRSVETSTKLRKRLPGWRTPRDWEGMSPIVRRAMIRFLLRCATIDLEQQKRDDGAIVLALLDGLVRLYADER
jgi:hypothetical protein